MANGGPPPDTAGDLARMQSLIASSLGGKKFGLGAFDVQASNFSLQGCAPFGKNITGLSSMLSSRKQKDGQLNYEKEVLTKMNNTAHQELAQACAGAAGVIYAGDLPSGSLPGLGGGGSFVEGLRASRVSEMEVS